VQWGDSKENINCSRLSCPHCFSNTQARHPLQLAKFSSAYSRCDLRTSHNGCIGNYGSCSHGVYPVYPLRIQSPNSPKRASTGTKGPVGLAVYPIELLFSMSAPCPRYLTSLDSWVVLLKMAGFLSLLISLVLVKGIIIVLLRLMDKFVLSRHRGTMSRAVPLIFTCFPSRNSVS
jgi:hypothetical protein